MEVVFNLEGHGWTAGGAARREEEMPWPVGKIIVPQKSCRGGKRKIQSRGESNL
jgi:hypothetical protein